MPKKIKHILQCPMTGKTPGRDGTGTGFGGQEWYNKRADLFIKYTLENLKKQTNKDFLLWITFRPQELLNPTTKKIARAVTDSGLTNIMSFNGTMFTEDKAIWHNQDLQERLAKCLPALKESVGDADYIYETNLDSDDMVHKKFSEIVLNYKPSKEGALYMTKGFVYNTEGRVADWNNPTSQQNYTIMFPKKIYLNAEKRLKYLKGFNTHEQVPTLFKNATQMPDGLYCSIIHGGNISTVWNHPFRGQEYIYEDQKLEILNNFL